MNKLEPKDVFSIFKSITAIPRPSKKERQISDWLVEFAKSHNIEVIQDDALNVIMRIPASEGYEKEDGIILQSHMDMVCEKESGNNHNFDTDPIDVYVDGDYIKARGTTLGGDDGIGMAMSLAVLTSSTLAHPSIEALFTTDEETGLTGANKLQTNILQGKRLINLDSEDDGQIFIGCAGGIDTIGKMYYTPEKVNDTNSYCATIQLTGLTGGHSGDDINKGRANANKLIARLLYRLNAIVDYKLVSIDGGNLRNAIPREAQITLVVPSSQKEKLRIALNEYVAIVEEECKRTEENIHWQMITTDMPNTCIPIEQTRKLIRTLYACPHGVIGMSMDIEGLVETSTNLASVKMKNDTNGAYIEICTSQRSSVESRKIEIMEMVECALQQVCDEIVHSEGYPGWKPNTDSPLLQTVRQAYIDCFGSEPQVKAIHAGLECGLFLEKYPYLDMVSIGPQMHFVHSPQEKLSISSTQRCWQWLCKIISHKS